MANLVSAILSGFRKKKDEEEAVAAPVKVTPAPQVQAQVQPSALSKIGTAISSTWNNFWQPSPDGVRVRDFVREVPGATVDTAKGIGKFAVNAARDTLTRFPAQAVLTASDALNLKSNMGKGEELNTINIPENDILGRVLFGDKPLESYIKQEKKVENFLDTKTPLPKNMIAPVGIMLGVANPILDAPLGGGVVKAGGKEIVEQAAKKGGKEIIEKVAKEGLDDVTEVVVKNTDELAPLLQELPKAARGTLDDAVAALKEKGFSISESVLKKLKSGKVVDGEGYVLQSNANGLIANFDKPLTNTLKREVPEVVVEQAAKETVPAATKQTTEVLPNAAKGVDDVAEATSKQGEELIQTSKPASGEEALKQADEGGAPPASTPPTGNGQAAGQSTEDYLTSRPIFENLTEDQKNTLGDYLKESGFESKLAEIKGAPVTRDEVLREALKVQDTLADPITRKQTVDTMAKLQNSQNKLAQLVVELDKAKKAGDVVLSSSIEKQIGEEFIKQRSVASFWGRLGNALQNPGDLNAPAGVKILNKIFGKIDEARIDEVVAAWNKVDKDNPEALRAFYFQFVEPTAKEIADEFKYINLLSSPLTQLRNIFGNIDAATVDPVTQVARGVLDRIYTMTGLQKQRTTYAREAIEQVTGMVEAIPKALKDAKAVLTRKAVGDNLDLARIPVGKYAENAKIFSQPGKLQGIRKLAGKATGYFLEKGGKVNDAMQAGDRFFKSIIEAGQIKAKTATAKRLGKEMTEETTTEIAKGAKEKGLELTLQSELKPWSHTQGRLNQLVDAVATLLMEGRKAPGLLGAGLSTVFPFIGVAANALKRVNSYLPGIGAINFIGADNAAVREIAARQVAGTIGLAASLWAVGRLAQEDRIAGAAPRDPAGKAAFLSAHPEYSVKLGDTWVQTSRMGVFGKLVETAIRYQEGRYHENDLTDSQLADLTQALTGAALDMSDESYLSSLKLLIDSFSSTTSQKNYARRQLASTPLRQNIPLVGFQGWLAKLIDPVNRQSVDSDGGYLSNALAGVNKNLPFLSFNYDPYLNPDNSVSTASRWNSISPYKIQEGNESFENLWSLDRFGRQMGSAETRFGAGEINFEDFVQTIENASSYFAGTDPQKIEMGEKGEVKLPTKQQLAAAMTQPKGIQLGGAIRGSQPVASVKLSGKAKVGAAPKVSAKGMSVRLPTASKSGSSKTTGISLAFSLKPPTPPKKKVGSKVLAEAEARKRKSRGVYLS